MPTTRGILDWLSHGLIVSLLAILIVLTLLSFPRYLRLAAMDARVVEVEAKVEFMRDFIVGHHMLPPEEKEP